MGERAQKLKQVYHLKNQHLLIKHFQALKDQYAEMYDYTKDKHLVLFLLSIICAFPGG